MLKFIFSFLVIAVSFGATFAQAQTSTTDETDKAVQLLRRDLRAEKKQLIALNLPLTPDEAAKFWPVYDQYTADMSKTYDEFYKLLKDYAQVQTTITDAQASSLMKRWAELNVQVAQTRQRYIPLVEKVIPARKAAQFFQVDRRLYALIDLQIMSQTPLVVRQQ
jgi:hypothetical protein